jgi:hypothetical protein
MAKYRKKPVVIEATQWWNHGDHDAVKRIHPSNPAAAEYDGSYGWVPTLEGGHIVTPSDWIITGVANEVYPCKEEIFKATYEPADD